MFNKDILLIDEETSGLDSNRHELIQLAGVLLDKRTLKEKKRFNSYIRPQKWKNRDPESSKVHKITWVQLKDAPDLKTVIRKFNKQFGSNVILSYYAGINDIKFLHRAYEKTGVKNSFDYHFFNIWGLFYTYAAKKKLLTSKKHFAGFGLETLMAHFKIESPQLHDALADTLVEAEILRRVVKELKV